MTNRFQPTNIQNKECFMAALYGRLSDEDRGKADEYMESASIKNQRDYLHYAVDCLNEKNQGEDGGLIKIYGEYYDDDFTGITFERPQFHKMMTEIIKGNIDCIIVKDFSRFGRDYIRISRYLEKDFEKKGHEVRFVAYSDHYDSLRDRPDIGVRILLFLNEEYSRSQSHKVTTGLESKMRSGKFIGAFAPYGYQKDPKDKNHLIIDEKASVIVKEIFRLNLKEGLGATEIARRLNQLRIESPSAYKTANGSKYKCGRKSGEIDYWTPDTVNNILLDEKYTGTMVQHKVRTKNFKEKEMEPVSKEKWIRVPDTHEAIVSKELFSEVQLLHANVVRNRNKCSDTSKYTGILFCGDCGCALTKHTERYKNSVYQSYLCRTHKRDSAKCYSNRIYDSTLDRIILQDLNKRLVMVRDLRCIIEKCMKEQKECTNYNSIENIIRKKERKIKQHNDILRGAEEKWCLGKLNDTSYEEIKKKNESDILRISEEIKLFRNLLKEDTNIDLWLSSFLEKGTFERIDRKTVIEAVDSIRIYHNNRLEIHYKFADIKEGQGV